MTEVSDFSTSLPCRCRCFYISYPCGYEVLYPCGVDGQVLMNNEIEHIFMCAYWSLCIFFGQMSNQILCL